MEMNYVIFATENKEANKLVKPISLKHGGYAYLLSDVAARNIKGDGDTTPYTMVSPEQLKKLERIIILNAIPTSNGNYLIEA